MGLSNDSLFSINTDYGIIFYTLRNIKEFGQMIRIAVCDDESAVLDEILLYIKKYAEKIRKKKYPNGELEELILDKKKQQKLPNYLILIIWNLFHLKKNQR